MSSTSRRQHEQQREPRVIHELCSMIIHILKYPSFPISYSSSIRPLSLSFGHFSPAAFASLFLGISASLMLFGSVIFLVGLLLMPWIALLVVLFYLAGLLYVLSEYVGSLFVHCEEFSGAS